MNDDVREIMARALHDDVGAYGEGEGRGLSLADADAILAALAEAGYVVVSDEFVDAIAAFLGPDCANIGDEAWTWGVPDSGDHDAIVSDMRHWLDFWPGKLHPLSEKMP